MNYNQSYQTQQLIKSIATIMMMAMGVRMTSPIMLQRQKKLYYAALEHPDPLISALLKREDFEIHDYTSAYSTEQAKRNLHIRYPGYRILYIREVTALPKRAKQLLQTTVEYAPVNPLYAADEWAALPSEKRIAIEQEAKRTGDKPYIYWLKRSGVYTDWVQLRHYYDKVQQLSEKYLAGEISYPDYPPFPSIKKSLTRITPSGYPEDVEECAARYSHEKLLRMAKHAGVRVSGSNQAICFKLKQARVLLQKRDKPRRTPKVKTDRCTECGEVIDWSKLNPDEKLRMSIFGEQLCAKCFRKLYPL